MDSMIEFWVRRVMATLYLLASVIAALRWNVLGYRASLYRERLLESGYRDIANIPVAINIVAALIGLMFLIAVISTIRILLQPGLGRAEARAE